MLEKMRVFFAREILVFWQAEILFSAGGKADDLASVSPSKSNGRDVNCLGQGCGAGATALFLSRRSREPEPATSAPVPT